MVKKTSVRESVNKGKIIGFNIVTSDATSTDIITEAQIDAYGYNSITDIHLKCTGDDGWIGLGKDAAAIGSGSLSEDIAPLFQDAYFSQENCRYLSLSFIRNAGTDVTVVGYVVLV